MCDSNQRQEKDWERAQWEQIRKNEMKETTKNRKMNIWYMKTALFMFKGYLYERWKVMKSMECFIQST